MEDIDIKNILEMVPEAKYLGATFRIHLQFKLHFTYASEQTEPRLLIFRQIIPVATLSLFCMKSHWETTMAFGDVQGSSNEMIRHRKP